MPSRIFPLPYRPNTFRAPLDESQVQSLNDNDNDIYNHLKWLRARVDELILEIEEVAGAPPTPHEILSVSHSDTLVDVPVEEDLIVRRAGLWSRLPVGTEAQVLAVVAGILAYATLEDLGHWEPMTNGDPDNPEMLFDGSGEIIMVWVPA
jgi:hypothetical protein